MLNQKDKFDRFAEVINKNADKQCRKIEKETEKIRKKELDRITAECTKEFENRLNYEFLKVDTALNKEISRVNAESKKYLADYRDSITDKVFSCAKQELMTFTTGEGYAEFLKESIKLIEENFSLNGTEEYCLYVRQQDEEAVRKMTEKQLHISGEILIGGIIGKSCDGKVKIDDSLDTRLEAQREWFKCQSKLRVVE